MATAAIKGKLELREFVNAQHEKLYNFCFYMLGDETTVENTVLEIFGRFGRSFRKLGNKKGEDNNEMILALFEMAWEHIQHSLERVPLKVAPGRDTREWIELDENLLAQDLTRSELRQTLVQSLAVRLSRIDPDFRSPVVLRDILGLSDAEVAQVLGLRWGVFRHRLHRGRLELLGNLGVKIPVPKGGVRPEARL